MFPAQNVLPPGNYLRENVPSVGARLPGPNLLNFNAHATNQKKRKLKLKQKKLAGFAKKYYNKRRPKIFGSARALANLPATILAFINGRDTVSVRLNVLIVGENHQPFIPV
jgi:hypothetical protein